ncbi:MAG: SsrA-binding protein SmpB [Candidatus Azambacteria bacterium]|nr:SsrA-binding protein SmpB [Candidatus Azambacteria bacterium]
MAIFSENRKAHFDYEILEKFEAGLVLEGAEVKSIKNGRMNLTGSYINLHGSELYLINAPVAPYQPKNQPADYDPYRSRKLLLKRGEISYLTGKIKQKGLTLIPLKVYNKGRRIKLEFGLARGKKQYDKRASIAKKETQRKIERAIKKEI